MAETEADVGLPARFAAIDLVTAALDRRNGFDEAASHPKFLKLPDQDRAFARALALATLRRLGLIDRILSRRLDKKPGLAVLNLLRIGLAQILAMDVPDFAAVSTTVRMAERENATRHCKGLVNAVLRGVLRDGFGEPSSRVNAPDWLYRRWMAQYGEAETHGICAMILEEPATDLSVKSEADMAALAEALEGIVLNSGTIRSSLRGDPTGWAEFSAGTWWVQDAAVALPARLFDQKDGLTALDMCSAPGGKTMQLAARGAKVTALDRSANRLKRVSENLARVGLEAEIVQANAEEWDDPRQFDAVLLDAPCSATGTFRRQPDVLWGARPSDVAKLADVQHRLLDSAANRVKPGGQLIYSTCSLEREEGETQVLAFLRRYPDFSTEVILAGEGGAPEASVTKEGWLRLLPHHIDGGQDGFFVARLRRKA